MPSAPQRFVAVVQLTPPSLKLAEGSCASCVAPPCSGVVMGMRTPIENGVSMSGTCSTLDSTDFAAVVWHW